MCAKNNIIMDPSNLTYHYYIWQILQPIFSSKWELTISTYIWKSTKLCQSESRIPKTQLVRERESGKFRAHLKHFICLLWLHMFTEWWYLSCLFEMKELNPITYDLMASLNKTSNVSGHLICPLGKSVRNKIIWNPVNQNCTNSQINDC